VLRAVEAGVELRKPADETLQDYYRAHRELGSRDRRLISGTVYALWRWRGWCGPWQPRAPRALIAAHVLEHPGQAAPEAIRWIVRDLWERQWLESMLVFQGLEDRAAWVSNHWKFGAQIADLVPSWVPNCLAVPVGESADRWLWRFIESIQRRPPLWLRAIRCEGAELARRLQALGRDAVVPTGLSRAVRVNEHFPLAEIERVLGPVYEVQDVASQVVGEWCSPRPGERWWDMCAGAGGKALDLAERVTEAGEVLATDLRPSALAEGKRRARRAGFENIRWVGADTTTWNPGTLFDGVLVDAPCAGLGMWGRSPDARWRTDLEDVLEAVRTQRALLDAAGRAVRPGGRLVYSVCSLTRLETDDVVDEFLARHPEFVPEPGPDPFQSSIVESGRLFVWPWMGPGTGMFIARFRRSKTPGGARSE
jgi:16S rRNA (cytosine967-C5)-methyltransferase